MVLSLTKYPLVILRNGLNIHLENYILGLGGRDVVPAEFEQIFEHLR